MSTANAMTVTLFGGSIRKSSSYRRFHKIGSSTEPWGTCVSSLQHFSMPLASMIIYLVNTYETLNSLSIIVMPHLSRFYRVSFHDVLLKVFLSQAMNAHFFHELSSASLTKISTVFRSILLLWNTDLLFPPVQSWTAWEYSNSFLSSFKRWDINNFIPFSRKYKCFFYGLFKKVVEIFIILYELFENIVLINLSFLLFFSIRRNTQVLKYRSDCN